MANPFAITPAGGQLGQGLAGLGQIMANKDAAEQARQDKLNMVNAGKVGTTRMVDMGDEVHVIDTRTGQTLRTIPKGISPQQQAQAGVSGQQFEQKQALAERSLEAQTAATQEAAALRRQQAGSAAEERALRAEETKQKIEARKVAKQEAKQAKIESGRSQLTSIDRVMGTIDQLESHPGLEAAMGLSSATYTLPGGDAKDFEVLFDQLSSQQFMDGVKQMKGMGALSESEGKKIASAAQALDLGMSEKAARREFAKIKSTLKTARARELKKYKAAGGDPAADAAESEAAIAETAMKSSALGAKTAADAIRNPPMTNQQGWNLMTDANGNRAYVGPNGEVQEL